MCVYIYTICVYIQCMYIYIYIQYVCIYVYIYTICVCIYIYIYNVCIYMCIYMGRGTQCFQDVVFMPSKPSFSNSFLKKCGRGESLWTTTCLKTVVGGEILLFHKACFCVNYGDQKTAYKDEVISGQPQFWGYYLV